MTNKDIETAISIFKHINPQLSENAQFYDKEIGYLPNFAVKYLVKNKLVSVWLDVKQINEWKLRILFKRHKEIPHTFFIQEVEDFYRIGWKIKKTYT